MLLCRVTVRHQSRSSSTNRVLSTQSIQKSYKYLQIIDPEQFLSLLKTLYYNFIFVIYV